MSDHGIGSTRIIAEVGVNHNGSVDQALRLVDAAIAAKASAVKFQTFRADRLVVSDTPRGSGRVLPFSGREESGHAMLAALELDEEVHYRLKAHCDEGGIEFISSPFDLASLQFLTEELGVATVKIPSGEITNAPLLLLAGRSEKELLLSTGMSTLDEVAQALAVLAFGLVQDPVAPSVAAFQAAYRSEPGQWVLRRQVTLLHCTTAYPTPSKAVNLRAMDAMAAAFGLPVGLSDHTLGYAVAVAAVARGAVVIEKHVTLDRTLPGPDHQASLEPEELRMMVQAIREVEQALGEGRKVPAPAELINVPLARKSLYAATAIGKGEPFTEDNVTALRPGIGVSPFRFWAYLQARSPRSYHAGELIDPL